MPYTQLANLDFKDIKSSLKDYLRAETDFTDYDFEGSTLSQLLDVLAYNTYYTSFNTNMVVNELFLDSASLRDNVVSLAKQLGYTPKSITASTARLNFNVNIPNNAPDYVLLKAGTGFLTNFDDTNYQFVATKDFKAEVANGVAQFEDIEIIEGTLITTRNPFSTAQKGQRFKIENSKADVNTLTIKVYNNSNSTDFEEWKKADNILDPAVNADSLIYFVNEIEDESYEIIFGDGVLGKSLDNGNVVEMSYVVTHGKDVNGAKTFTFGGVLDDGGGTLTVPFSISGITTLQKAEGGEDIESVAKIKYLAPKFFSSQNRAVTSSDYEVIARNVYPAISDIIVFGGEEQVPPDYGKVFIAIKPTDASFLSAYTKNQIVNDLKKYSIGSIRPVLVDPSILYVELDSKIFFDANKTELLPQQVAGNAAKGITEYLKTSQTEKFNGKFRYSKFVSVIDESDRAIKSNLTSVTLRKDFIAQLNSSSFYEICYQNPFDRDCDNPVVSSTGFITLVYPNYTTYLEDRSGKIVLYRLDPVSGDKIVLNDSLGDVYYSTGEIMLYDLTIIQGSFSDNRIELRVKTASNDIAVLREVYLDVDVAKSKFIATKE